MKDIDMLMENVGQKSKQPNRQKYVNSWNNITSRGRKEWNMISWREKSKNSKANHSRDPVLNALSQGQRNANTTRRSIHGISSQGNQVPMLSGSDPTHRFSKTSGAVPTAARKVETSIRLSILGDEGEHEYDEESVPLPPAPRTKRKRAIDTENAVANILPRFAASTSNFKVLSSRSDELSRDRIWNAGTGEIAIPNLSSNDDRERQIGLDLDAPRKKKRRTRGHESNDCLTNPLRPQDVSSSRANPSHSTGAQSRVRQHQERNYRLGRQPARATSSAIEGSQTQTYTPQSPYPINDIPSYQTPYTYTHNQIPYGNPTSIHTSSNGPRDSSLCGIANELGLPPSFYGATMKQVQHNCSNGGYVDPLRRYSDPPKINPYQTINGLGSFGDGLGYEGAQHYLWRRASDPLGSSGYGNAYGSLDYHEKAGQSQCHAPPHSGQVQHSWMNDPYITKFGEVANHFPEESVHLQPIFGPQQRFSSPIGLNGYVESLGREVARVHEQQPMPAFENHSQINAAVATAPLQNWQPIGETAYPTNAGYVSLNGDQKMFSTE